MERSLPFKEEYPLGDRTSLSTKVKRANPDRIPVIVERHKRSKDIPELAKRKYLVPRDISVANFIFEIRKGLKLSSNDAIWFFADGKYIPHSATIMSQVYDSHKDKDGFLYITYSGENYFGRP
jgi:GABA(A) receptor-associated protein